MNKNCHFFYYKIKEVTLDGSTEISNGITVGANYTEAVKNLEDYYLNDLDEILILVAIGDSPVLCNSDFDEKSEEMKEAFITLYTNKDFYIY